MDINFNNTIEYDNEDLLEIEIPYMDSILEETQIDDTTADTSNEIKQNVLSYSTPEIEETNIPVARNKENETRDIVQNHRNIKRLPKEIKSVLNEW